MTLSLDFILCINLLKRCTGKVSTEYFAGQEEQRPPQQHLSFRGFLCCTIKGATEQKGGRASRGSLPEPYASAIRGRAAHYCPRVPGAGPAADAELKAKMARVSFCTNDLL